MKGGKKVIVEKHRLEGVFIARGKEDALCTRNMVEGEAVYGEKRVSVEVCIYYLHHLQIAVTILFMQQPDGTKIEYRVWNPFRSKLAAAIIGGVENVWIKPESKVLYLGAASGTTVSHVSG